MEHGSEDYALLNATALATRWQRLGRALTPMHGEAAVVVACVLLVSATVWLLGLKVGVIVACVALVACIVMLGMRIVRRSEDRMLLLGCSKTVSRGKHDGHTNGHGKNGNARRSSDHAPAVTTQIRFRLRGVRWWGEEHVHITCQPDGHKWKTVVGVEQGVYVVTDHRGKRMTCKDIHQVMNLVRQFPDVATYERYHDRRRNTGH